MTNQISFRKSVDISISGMAYFGLFPSKLFETLFLSIKWNLIRLGGPASGIVPKIVNIKTVHCIKMTLVQLFSVRSLPDLPQK